jgi:CHU_C Type IX secretion signal domain/FG-GAP-like repeat/ASPIC and UnbV
MKITLAILCFIVHVASCYSQQFTLVTNVSGDIAHDHADSESCLWVDFNNDGWQDLFIGNWANGSGGTDGNDDLYKNNGDGTFTRLAGSIVCNDGQANAGGAWGDYNNDGFPDLLVTGVGHNLLYKNNGDETFTKITSGAIVTDVTNSKAAAWADYDGDGYLDVFVATSADITFPAKNALYHNNGNETFTRITEGAIANDVGDAFDCSWVDYDNDCDLDLFIANLNTGNILYRNDGSNGFTKIAQGLGDNGNLFTTSCSWADYNNDGYIDLALGYGNSTGGVALFMNNGDGTFVRILTSGITTEGSGARGTAWGDYDNDGDLDLLIVTIQKSYLYSNNGDGSFTKIDENFIASADAQAVSWCDYNNDGYLDFIVATGIGDLNYLYKNNGEAKNWIEVDARPAFGDHFGLGATVRIPKGNQSRVLSSHSGRGGQASFVAHFGLGNETHTDLAITWPSGKREELKNIQSNQKITVHENPPFTTDLNLGKDTVVCNASGLILTTVGGYDAYLWSNNSRTPAIHVDRDGLYWVQVRYGCSGFFRDSIRVKFDVSLKLDLGADRIVCKDGPIVLHAGNRAQTYHWQDGSTDSLLHVNNSGKFWLSAANDCGISSDTVLVNYVHPPKLDLGADTTLCDGTSLTLRVGAGFNDVIWSNGPTTAEVDVVRAGTYTVRATFKTCTAKDTISVTFDKMPLSLFGPDPIKACPGEPVVLAVHGRFDSYEWSDGSVDSTLSVQESGSYRVLVKNACGKLSDSVRVELLNKQSVFLPNVITPNDDTNNEQFKIDASLVGCNLIICNRWGKEVFQSDNYQNNWAADGQPAGTYFYLLTERQCSAKFSGWINVLR